MPPCGGHERLSDPIHSVYLYIFIIHCIIIIVKINDIVLNNNYDN